MSNFVEIDVDFGYCGEVEMVLAHDEGGEHEDVEFYRDGLLAEENAKLRELIQDMYTDLVNCDRNLRLHGRKIMAYTRYAHRMHELGIKVN